MHPALKTPFLKIFIYILKVFAGAGAFLKSCLREFFACGKSLPVEIYKNTSSVSLRLPPSPMGRLVLSAKLLIDILHIDEPVLAAEVVVTVTDVVKGVALAEDGFWFWDLVTVNEASLAVKGISFVG